MYTQSNPINADPLFRAVQPLPADGDANAAEAFDLGQPTLYPIRAALQIDLPATPSLADTKTVTLTVKDSADNVTFTAIPEVPIVIVTGAGGIGGGAVSRTFPLPGTTRQFIRTEAAVAAAGGDNTAVSVTSQLLVQL